MTNQQRDVTVRGFARRSEGRRVKGTNPTTLRINPQRESEVHTPARNPRRPRLGIRFIGIRLPREPRLDDHVHRSTPPRLSKRPLLANRTQRVPPPTTHSKALWGATRRNRRGTSARFLRMHCACIARVDLGVGAESGRGASRTEVKESFRETVRCLRAEAQRDFEKPDACFHPARNETSHTDRRGTLDAESDGSEVYGHVGEGPDDVVGELVPRGGN